MQQAGIGWKYPVMVDTCKHIVMSEYEQDIKEALLILLNTGKGERVMRPDYGCGIHDYMFEVVNVTLLSQIEYSVKEALTQWEPRIEVLTVNTSTENLHNGELIIDIQYKIVKTNRQDNFVYPFYLKGKSND